MKSKWTEERIPDQSGRVIIVTGANSGIGFETAKELGRKGAEIIFACRDQTKAQKALGRIRAEIPGFKGEVILLDLANLQSIRNFAEQYHSKYDRLDVLLNNAGIMMVPYSLTVDGFENQFGTNHLGHFALTGLLINLLLQTQGSRVVNVSSNAHYAGEDDFSDLLYQNGKSYSPQLAYSRSKLANLLFTYELQRRLSARDAQTIVTASHPGISNTALADHIFEHWHIKPLRSLMGILFQSAAMGALPSLRAAVDPDALGGQYYGPDGSGERSGYPVEVQSSQASRNLDTAGKLWEVSEGLTGISYLS
jgi:NAD(P)-dependent dehydrogenase (short-subunit alcohol dehydrogenase family)